MSIKRYKPEQIVNLLRQVEVETANGKTTPQACRDAEITMPFYLKESDILPRAAGLQSVLIVPLPILPCSEPGCEGEKTLY